eukprot:TRINITY_DN37810_c0_g1_i1.p1 TRINITY_DN37810_c0_g1~~TRINITY_DN37810_c0_g1_i1.p1  ORF type:complete len:221 (+),score=24.78 TRINITY_DN37810_c0_g1_i1:47-709(+)
MQKDDRRFLMLRKSGYCGHIPMFRRTEPQREVKPKIDLSKSLFQTHFKPPQPVLRESDPEPVTLPERSGKKISAWSMQEVPESRHQYPFKPMPRPASLKRVVGFGGHRQGVAFITGETFTQEEIITCPQKSLTYEPDKSNAKGRNLTYSANRSPDGTPFHDAIKLDKFLAPRIPGGPSLLRSSRRPSSATVYSKRSWPAYPIMRGPTRVKTGGHDVFLVN